MLFLGKSMAMFGGHSYSEVRIVRIFGSLRSFLRGYSEVRILSFSGVFPRCKYVAFQGLFRVAIFWLVAVVLDNLRDLSFPPINPNPRTRQSSHAFGF